MEEKKERRLLTTLGFEDREDAAPQAQHTERSGKKLRESLMGKDE